MWYCFTKFSVSVITMYAAAHFKGLEEAENLGLTIFHAGTALKDGALVSNGGRVLVVMAMESDFETAASVAQKGAAMIKFEGAFYRKDIGFRVVSRYVLSLQLCSYPYI